MRLSLRFVVPLFAALGLIAYATMPLVDMLMSKWFAKDIEIRASLIANTLSDSVLETWSGKDRVAARGKMKIMFEHAAKDERLFAMGFCDASGTLQAKTAQFPEIGCPKSPLGERGISRILEVPSGPLHVSFRPISAAEGAGAGELVLVHDMSFIQRRSTDTKKYIFIFFVVLALLVSLITVVIAQLSWLGWVRGLKSILSMENFLKPQLANMSPELRPLAKNLRSMLKELQVQRSARDESQVSWSPAALKEVLRRDLAGEEVLIVSNREPYIHVRRGEAVEIQNPASGLVTALEPVMRACSGTWIAHGSGSADKETVDMHDRIQVPPEDPAYTLRRVWLSEEEEKGYYYGFANEGLWPLCHIAHTRPLFRSTDWAAYLAVNEKFAKTVVDESKTKDPVILVQDYHFAMLPRMIKRHLPDATVISFWHIPWPNAESFGICPWREEILQGLLGSDILGFHTRFHCNNFIDTVDRYLESRIDRDTSTISYGGIQTAVRHYPISIEWPLRWLKNRKSVSECRAGVIGENDIPSTVKIGVGIDRLDYTKGILERFYAVERLLELDSSYVGKIVFIQIAAPTRATIREYRNFAELVQAEAERINRRFAKGSYRPIVLRMEHHEAKDVVRYFRAADFCFVSSLHDGMNLVAKEFIASRDDEDGVLILSQFAGAAKELPEAVIVNPYDIEQCAAAIKFSLEMDHKERAGRMRSMRGYVQEFNVYRWAGRMLVDAARMRKRGRFSSSIDEVAAR